MQLKERVGLEKLSAYHGGMREDGILLNANESPYNMPKSVKEKLLQEFSNVQFNRYPEIDSLSLRTLIAESFNLKAQNVQLGNGSSALIAACCLAFGGTQRRIAYINPSFSMYETYALLSDSIPCPFALEDDFSLDTDKLLSFLQAQKPDILILCNPNNPTGTLYLKEDLIKIIKNANCLVLLDEAYTEFCDQSLVDQLQNYDNLAILRTFSKAYGLASSRVGYILSNNSNIIDVLTKVLLPFQINTLSLIAAKVVYEHKSSYEPIICDIIKQRDCLTKDLEALNCIVYPSSTNFILFSLGKKPQDNKDLSDFLAQGNVFVRDFSSVAILKNAIRLTIGSKEENEQVLDMIKQFLKVGDAQ